MNWVVVSGGNGWHVRSLMAAATRRGIDLTWCDFATAWACEGPLGGALDTASVVLPRTLPGGSLEQVIFRMDILHRALERGARVVNPPGPLRLASTNTSRVPEWRRPACPCLPPGFAREPSGRWKPLPRLAVMSW